MAIFKHIFTRKREVPTFEQHYLPMSGAMYDLAYRLLQSEEDAEDVVQDILLRLYEHRDQYAPPGADRSYVLTMVRNLCIDYLRTKPDVPIKEESDEDDEMPTLTPRELITDSFERQMEADDYLAKLLDSLPDRARQIVRMRIIEDLSFEEIESLTGITQGNIRVILSRTLQKLRNHDRK